MNEIENKKNLFETRNNQTKTSISSIASPHLANWFHYRSMWCIHVVHWIWNLKLTYISWLEYKSHNSMEKLSCIFITSIDLFEWDTFFYPYLLPITSLPILPFPFPFHITHFPFKEISRNVIGFLCFFNSKRLSYFPLLLLYGKRLRSVCHELEIPCVQYSLCHVETIRKVQQTIYHSYHSNNNIKKRKKKYEIKP